ncbi:MAG: hypothetical protein Q7R35_06595 [Elusimicrobiota bacterium]|nr:hypothetical protein [Elusimicrobiota bacterium]
MPEMTFGVLIFSVFSAMAFSGAALWLLGRKARASRRRTAPFSQAFLAGSVTFSLVYIINRLAFPLRPKTTAVFNLALLAGILLFRALKKRLRRRRRPKAAKKHPLHAEAAALEQMLSQDPLNAFCLEKLSEIYEKMGENDRALEAAREAFKLDPSMKTRWRVDELKKEISEKKRHKGGFK